MSFCGTESNLRVVLSSACELGGAVARLCELGGAVARLWIAATAELARSGNLVTFSSSSSSSSVAWLSFVSSSCSSPFSSLGGGVVVTGAGVVVCLRRANVSFLTRGAGASEIQLWVFV